MVGLYIVVQALTFLPFALEQLVLASKDAGEAIAADQIHFCIPFKMLLHNVT
jgi:hypothetical protein